MEVIPVSNPNAGINAEVSLSTQLSNTFTASAEDECNARIFAGREGVSRSSDPLPLSKHRLVSGASGLRRFSSTLAR
jgi:hypothetical protein